MLPPEVRPGSRLGNYLIEGELGRGGMGVVLKAKDDLGRTVAIKVLPRTLVSDARLLERFKREAMAGARVVHPNVTLVYTHGEANGWPFLVFEFMPGGSLHDRVKKKGPIPWKEAVKLAAQVARGLGAVHDAGLVHRDLKPANVLIDGAGNPKLGDFGLVRKIERGNSLTGAGEVVGTAQYLAPEQAEDGRVGPAADLYALGATIYYLITGAPPFEGEGLSVITKHLTARAAPPSSRVAGIPKALDRLVLRLLEKKPEQRGQSAAAVADELEALLAAKEAPAKAAPRSITLPLIAAGTVVALAAIGAVVYVTREPPVPLSFSIDFPLEGAEVPEGKVHVRGSVKGPQGASFTANGAPVEGGRLEIDVEPDKDGGVTVSVEGDGSVKSKTVKVVPRKKWFLDLRRADRPKKLPPELQLADDERVYRWTKHPEAPLELVYVPAGKFMMGLDDGSVPSVNTPVHEHWVKAYWIGRCQVTWRQYNAFCEATNHKPAPRPEWYGELTNPLDNPVVNVTWQDAKDFCAWQGGAIRLPSEAEWEHASRGPDDSIYPWGNDEPWIAGKFGNFADKRSGKHYEQSGPAEQIDDGFKYTAPVRSFAGDMSGYGAYDMGSNVQEWCEDWYDAGVYKRYAQGKDFQSPPQQADPQTPKRVVRGGSYAQPYWDMKGSARMSPVALWFPDQPNDVVGFRVALGAD
jgi:formylglycine-generating enzyme required for sulfatase activity